MAPTVLLVATATRWLGTARMPRDLVKAGWNVALLAPKGSLAEHSHYVRKCGHLPDGATPLQWVYSFAAMVKATAPRLVMPCDDTAFRLMQQLAAAPPDGMQPVLHMQLARLIADSLGDPAHYRGSVDKTLVCRAAAEAAGVRVPPYGVVADPAEAKCLRRRTRMAGRVQAQPIHRRRRRGDLRRRRGAGARVRPAGERHNTAAEPNRSRSAGCSGVHSGPHAIFRRHGLAGRAPVCGYAVDKVAGEPKGAASVVRYFHSAELQESAARLASAFGASGIFAPEYIVHERSGEPYLLEVNRRTDAGHPSRRILSTWAPVPRCSRQWKADRPARAHDSTTARSAST